MNLLVTVEMLDQDIAELEKMFDKVTCHPWTLIGKGYDAKTTLQLLKETEADALITELDDVSAEVLEAYHNLVFIGDCRGNPVNVCLKTATAYNIPVLYAPARNAQAVAELLVASLICFMRNVPAALEWTRRGSWLSDTIPYQVFRGHEIFGKKIGLVGLGAVGRVTAKILSACGAEILYYDPFVDAAPEGYTKVVELETIFTDCDVVSIHLPVRPSTIGMITADLLNKMKPTAIFVNSARSAVMDTDALLDCLKKKRIAGAVLDVYDHEPPQEKDLELMSLDNVLATPHIYGATFEVADHQSRIMTENIKKWFAKKDLAKIVFNKEVLGVQNRK